MQRADSQLQRVRAMLAAAQATPLDTLEIANRRLELQTAVAQNRHQRAVCLSQLEELVGAPLDPAPLPPLPVAQLAAADYEAAAMVARQEFTVVSAQGAQAAAQRRAALSALYPQLAAVAEYHYADPGVEYIDPDWNDYYSVGVQMQWNLWDWGQARREANAAVCAQRRAEQENSRLQAQVRREVRETVEQLNSLADRIALQRRLVQQEALRRDVMQQRFEQAQGTSLDLRDAEDRVTEAELALAQYIAQWRQARFLLDYYTGSMGGTR
jgi:outer membrane protein TolC